MVLLTYKGQNNVYFGSRKIVPGINDIPDDEFYKLMKYPTFKSRVESSKFSVPASFPLELPKNVEKDSKVKSSQDELDTKDADDHEDEEEATSGRLNVKQTLKNIQKSEDLEYLKDLVETDDRQKVKDAAQKKLDALESK